MKRFVALLLLAAAPAWAQDDDLSLIPSAVEQPDKASVETDVVASTHDPYYTIFGETVFTAASYRHDLAVASPSSTTAWADRTSLDAMGQWELGNRLSVHLSDRLNLTVGDGVAFPRQAVRNDVREAYLTWEAVPELFLEAGRINLRNGVAVGYNPTDFFKSRSAVATASADPSSARDNRLGTFMMRGQYLWNGGSLTVAYAPRLRAPTPLDAGSDDGFGLHLDYTNASDRVLVAFDWSAVALNPQFLVYHESGRTKFGLNLSYQASDSVIVYGEWAGGQAPNQIADAFAFGKRVGTLPDAVPVLPTVSFARGFHNDAAVGFSWSGEDKESLYFEYHFHQAGMTGRQWNDWFAIGATPLYASLMWYVRGYASTMQEPIGRHRLFLRLNRDDAWRNNLSIGIIAFVAPTDGSSMAQAYASYALDDHWSVSAYAGGNFGGAHTEWGSYSSAATFSFRLARYL